MDNTNQTTTPAATPTPPPVETKKIMPRKTMLLIVFLALVTGLLVYAALYVQNGPTSKTATTTVAMSPTPTPVPAHTILTMSQHALQTGILQSSSSAAAPSGNAVDVNIDSSDNSILGLQLELSYDPAVLGNVTLTPGTFFPNASILYKNIDQKNGRISYVLGIQPTGKAIVGQGTVATISYTILPTATGTATKIDFLPKTMVTAEGYQVSMLKSAIGITLSLPQKSPTTTQNVPVSPTTGSGY
ncbi:MAG: cohesin domain-containing protein [Candidatus Levyibacteriota bacterium]